MDTRLPAMLRSGQRLRGVFNSLPSPAIVEMCAYAGFDFIIIDNEHGSAGFETTENMLRAARASGIVPVVRCFASDISRILDMGASAVQVPMVNSAEEARELVQQVRYPRTGRRGSVLVRVRPVMVPSVVQRTRAAATMASHSFPWWRHLRPSRTLRPLPLWMA
ncbi:aldolase/citrate lyase family protein [Polaromonas sp. P1(28)-13]|nr:aldolase/citrate lyase family protein [Polaromonas sp. P1(28)-13]